MKEAKNMVKTQLCLWIEYELKEAMRSQNINLSELMEDTIKAKLGMVDLDKNEKDKLIIEKNETLKESSKFNAKLSIIENRLKEIEKREKEKEPKVIKRIVL